MYNFKKVICCLLSLVFVFCCFWGCNSAPKEFQPLSEQEAYAISSDIMGNIVAAEQKHVGQYYEISGHLADFKFADKNSFHINTVFDADDPNDLVSSTLEIAHSWGNNLYVECKCVNEKLFNETAEYSMGDMITVCGKVTKLHDSNKFMEMEIYEIKPFIEN